MAFPTLAQEMATSGSPEGDRTGKETEARGEELPCAGAPDPSPGRDGAGQTDRQSKPHSTGGGLVPPPRDSEAEGAPKEAGLNNLRGMTGPPRVPRGLWGPLQLLRGVTHQV